MQQETQERRQRILVAYSREEKAEIVETICIRLMDGESLRKICSDESMPDKATVLRWLNDQEDKEFATSIARARDLQADAIDDDIADIVARLLDGKLDPNVAKTAIWAHQWRAGKLRPKRYGDKLDLGNSDGQPFTIEIVK